MRNNPLRYTDPSGHNPECGPDGVWCSNNFEEAYGISFGGNWSGDEVSQRAQRAVRTAVRKVARKFASEMGLDNPAMAFSMIYGAVHFQWGNCDDCKGAGGYAYGYQKEKGYRLIAFESISGIRYDDTIDRGVKNVVHELGHLYYHTLGTPNLGASFSRDALRPNEPSNRWDWQQHPPSMNEDGEEITSELFADTFLAWTYDAWNPNPPKTNPLAVDNAKGAMDALVP